MSVLYTKCFDHVLFFNKMLKLQKCHLFLSTSNPIPCVIIGVKTHHLEALLTCYEADSSVIRTKKS